MPKFISVQFGVCPIPVIVPIIPLSRFCIYLKVRLTPLNDKFFQYATGLVLDTIEYKSFADKNY
jgi:hypothetical protein